MGNEIQTPQTKEFAVSSIHDETLLAKIKELMQGMGSGLLETSLDDEYLHVALFSDSFARFIDLKTLSRLKPEIRDHLNRDADTASFVVVDSKEPLPIQHPRLYRLQDVLLEWIANEIAKGREWDKQECERYYREVREQGE
jgi:hypothetical protein